MKFMKNRELLEEAVEIIDHHDYIETRSLKLLEELKRRKISKNLKDEFDYKSIIDDLEYITSMY